jgi:transposase
MAKDGSAEATIREIKRKARRQYSAEEMIRIVVEGLRGERARHAHCNPTAVRLFDGIRCDLSL